MHDMDEHGITAAVIERLEATPDARLRRIMTSLVRHLHDFVRDVELTEAEWAAAIDFLTRTGQACTDTRQEFILLSDTLGVSILVDAIAHRAGTGITESTVLGPFYVEGAPERANGTDISAGLAGVPLLVEASVAGRGNQPLPGAIVDVWHSDDEGFYDVQRPDRPGPALRARFHADAAGRVRFWTIQPRSYPVPVDGPAGEMLRATGRHAFRPAHVHFRLAAPGHATLVTHIFVAGDAYLDSDAVFAVKRSLIRDFAEQPPGTAPDGRVLDRPWRRLDAAFVLAERVPGA